MNRAEFNDYCRSLPHTTHVIQWGNADVWKIGGKIFAIGSGWGEERSELDVKISFKCSDFSYSLLTEEEGIIPAPYLARAKWVQLESEHVLSDDETRSYIEAAYQIIGQKLPKKLRVELGFDQSDIKAGSQDR